MPNLPFLRYYSNQKQSFRGSVKAALEPSIGYMVVDKADMNKTWI